MKRRNRQCIATLTMLSALLLVSACGDRIVETGAATVGTTIPLTLHKGRCQKLGEAGWEGQRVLESYHDLVAVCGANAALPQIDFTTTIAVVHVERTIEAYPFHLHDTWETSSKTLIRLKRPEPTDPPPAPALRIVTELATLRMPISPIEFQKLQ